MRGKLLRILAPLLHPFALGQTGLLFALSRQTSDWLCLLLSRSYFVPMN